MTAATRKQLENTSPVQREISLYGTPISSRYRGRKGMTIVYPEDTRNMLAMRVIMFLLRLRWLPSFGE
jgi:uncharacterized membrane protein (UPF0127 family)